MKLILFFLLLTYLVACSGEVGKKEAPEKKIKIFENPSENYLNPQTKLNQQHISGRGETNISGAPSSSHISGQ